MFSRKNKLIDINKYTQLQEQLGSLLYDCNNIQIDSRKVELNDIFCAYPGGSVDGRQFINDVIKKNPAAILYDKPYSAHIDYKSFSTCNLQQYVGTLAATKYNFPTKKMITIGVTGTNGKTSISHWLNQAFMQLNYTTAIVGTTGCGIYPNIEDLSSTTPDPVTLQKLFLDFKQKNVDVAAIEVSSHALHQGRVNGFFFDTAIFTNLTQDHLDYHGTLEEYFQAKEQLFYWQDLKHAIINIDDKYGDKLYESLKNDQHINTNIISYAVEREADIYARNIQLTLEGMTFDLYYQQQVVQIRVKIIGLFNVYNLLAVFASLLAKNIDLAQVATVATYLTPVVGRMEAIIYPNYPLVVVDYSHTPDSLQKALETLKEIQHDKLYCVFGCGGNRDKAKRKIMGDIASKLADYTYVTSDNPRFEKPTDIINDICAGFTVMKTYEVIESRKDAIVQALSTAQAGDIILIAGKGHETYQEINGVKYHFSDAEVVYEYCQGK